MLISIIVWNEMPNQIQSLGIVIAMVAIVIANMSSKQNKSIKGSAAGSATILLLLFVVGGIAEFLNKIFQRLVSLDYKPIFLFVVFSTALLLSILSVVIFKEKLYKKDIVAIALTMVSLILLNL